MASWMPWTSAPGLCGSLRCYLNIKLYFSEEMSSVRHKVNQLEKVQPGGKFAAQVLNPHLEHPFLAAVCVKKSLLDAVESILGPDIVLLSSTLFTKYPAQVC